MIKIVDLLLILPIVVLVYWYLTPKKWRSFFLLICSILFIALFSIKYMLYFLFNIAVVYVTGIFIRKKTEGKKLLLKFTLIWLIGNLCFFKYANLFFETVFKIGFKLFLLPRVEFPNILLPLGLSYVIFRLIHYIVEIYRNNTPQGSFVDFALYVLFFPTFLAGPIERFQRFYPQIKEMSSFDISHINYGLFRIIKGLAKKLIIANNLEKIIIPIFLSPQLYARIILILAAYSLTIKIYMDFSGYTDMAIGISRLFGYKIVENFNRPFLQRNIALFWRSWHISLYSWIRDYFFFPLFGSRSSIFKLYLGIFLTMLVFQLWHRASVGFLILGIYHGTGLIIWQLFQELKKRQPLIKDFFFHGIGKYKTFLTTETSKGKVLSSPTKLANEVSCKWLDLVSVFFTFSFASFSSIFFNFNIKDSLNIIKRLLT